MPLRPAYRAGSFYEGAPAACRQHAQRILDSAGLPADLPAGLVGGLVPHAGWVYSGRLAAMTLRALDTCGPPDTVVLFGADHVGTARRGEVYDRGAWQTPLGDAVIDEDLAAALIAAGEGLRANPSAHSMEHSIEVQVPLIQTLWPECRIVPVAAPPSAEAVDIGRAVGGVLAERGGAVRVIGSTDLSHHGGHFPAPGGRGRSAWGRPGRGRSSGVTRKPVVVRRSPTPDQGKRGVTTRPKSARPVTGELSGTAPTRLPACTSRPGSPRLRMTAASTCRSVRRPRFARTRSPARPSVQVHSERGPLRGNRPP